MAQIAKMEGEVEIKSSGEQLYEIFRSKGYMLPKICPNIVKDLQLLKGDWNSVGSVRQWTFVTAGNSEMGKDIVEAIDEKKKSMTFKTVEGEVTKHYKSFKSRVEVITTKLPNTKPSSSLVKWNIEYEKHQDSHDAPSPNKYLDSVIFLTKTIDAYLLNNA